jgi:hypothetical protein
VSEYESGIAGTLPVTQSSKTVTHSFFVDGDRYHAAIHVSYYVNLTGSPEVVVGNLGTLLLTDDDSKVKSVSSPTTIARSRASTCGSTLRAPLTTWRHWAKPFSKDRRQDGSVGNVAGEAGKLGDGRGGRGETCLRCQYKPTYLAIGQSITLDMPTANSRGLYLIADTCNGPASYM